MSRSLPSLWPPAPTASGRDGRSLDPSGRCNFFVIVLIVLIVVLIILIIARVLVVVLALRVFAFAILTIPAAQVLAILIHVAITRLRIE